MQNGLSERRGLKLLIIMAVNESYSVVHELSEQNSTRVAAHDKGWGEQRNTHICDISSRLL